MASKLERAILAAEMREYYNPHTGEGLGALDFAWTGLILEMEADSPWDADRV
jgi:hypothetical protein